MTPVVENGGLTPGVCPDFRGELVQYAKDIKYFILPEHEELG